MPKDIYERKIETAIKIIADFKSKQSELTNKRNQLKLCLENKENAPILRKEISTLEDEIKAHEDLFRKMKQVVLEVLQANKYEEFKKELKEIVSFFPEDENLQRLYVSGVKQFEKDEYTKLLIVLDSDETLEKKCQLFANNLDAIEKHYPQHIFDFFVNYYCYAANVTKEKQNRIIESFILFLSSLKKENDILIFKYFPLLIKLKDAVDKTDLIRLRNKLDYAVKKLRLQFQKILAETPGGLKSIYHSEEKNIDTRHPLIQAPSSSSKAISELFARKPQSPNMDGGFFVDHAAPDWETLDSKIFKLLINALTNISNSLPENRKHNIMHLIMICLIGQDALYYSDKLVNISLRIMKDDDKYFLTAECNLRDEYAPLHSPSETTLIQNAFDKWKLLQANPTFQPFIVSDQVFIVAPFSLIDRLPSYIEIFLKNLKSISDHVKELLPRLSLDLIDMIISYYLDPFIKDCMKVTTYKKLFKHDLCRYPDGVQPERIRSDTCMHSLFSSYPAIMDKPKESSKPQYQRKLA